MSCKAYIDGANLHNGIKELGWLLDHRKFRAWLSHKYGVTEARLFIGKIEGRDHVYKILEDAGFQLAFKETVRSSDGKVKGNCDTNLVVAAMADHYEKRCDKAIIVTSDGDFTPLISHLNSKSVSCVIVSPRNNCSLLLRRLNVPIIYLDTQRSVLERPLAQNKKAPGEQMSRKGPFSENAIQ
jgi:uncharacterized LabA/DUF88 family protein